jgi:nucleoside permease NupC
MCCVSSVSQVLSVIYFFSFFIQMFYYWGVMQWVVAKVGWMLQVTIGTTAVESLAAAANIFFGPVRIARIRVVGYVLGATPAAFEFSGGRPQL